MKVTQSWPASSHPPRAQLPGHICIVACTAGRDTLPAIVNWQSLEKLGLVPLGFARLHLLDIRASRKGFFSRTCQERSAPDIVIRLQIVKGTAQAYCAIKGNQKGYRTHISGLFGD